MRSVEIFRNIKARQVILIIIGRVLVKKARFYGVAHFFKNFAVNGIHTVKISGKLGVDSGKNAGSIHAMMVLNHIG